MLSNCDTEKDQLLSKIALMDVTFGLILFIPALFSLLRSYRCPSLFTFRSTSFSRRRFRLPRLTWMHLSGYSRPSFVGFWTGRMFSHLSSLVFHFFCRFCPRGAGLLCSKPPLPEIIPYFFSLLVYLQGFFFIILYPTRIRDLFRAVDTMLKA